MNSTSLHNVVVTGASSGIGACIAHDLQTRGYRVLPTVRQEEQAAELREQGMHPLLLDVTQPEQIADVAATVAQLTGEGGLSGLVNNAGAFLAGPLECLSIDQIRHVYNVNVFGLLELTQALLPLIRKAPGRIVNVGSMSGRVSLPLAGPYASSKFALEAISDSLRRELTPWNIKVALINPGNIDTPMWDKSITRAKSMQEALPETARQLYGGRLQRAFNLVGEIGNHKDPPEYVARCVFHALTSRRPRPRYFVGSAWLLDWAVWMTPDRLLDWLIERKLRSGAESE